MSTVSIPLSKLQLSPLNVRHPSDGDVANEVHDLQASILAHGLMNPLVVHKMTKPRGTFGVIAGGRRLRALQGLALDGRIAADHAVDCYETAADAAAMTEMSIAENTVRVALKPTAEYEAFAKLAGDGVDEAAIAERFGITILHVRQRMRLGRLHPDILAALDESRITLDQAKAYASTEDQALQARVFKEMSGGWNHYAHNIRNAIRGAGSAYNTEMMLRVVGVQAYTDAGGTLEEDLFEGGFRVIAPGTLSELYYAKVEQQKRDLGAKLPEAAVITTSGTDLGRPLFLQPELDDAQRDRLAAIDQRSDAIAIQFEKLAEAPMTDDDPDEPLAAVNPKKQRELDALRAEMAALQDEGEAIHANAKVEMPDGPIVVYTEPAANGLTIRGYYRPKGYAEDGAPAATGGSAGDPPAASLDKPIGLDPRIGYGDVKAAVKAETGLTADALEVMRTYRREILRGMLVDESGSAGWAIGAALLPFMALRHLLSREGRRFGMGGDAATELGVAQGAFATAYGPVIEGAADDLERQPCHQRWQDTLMYLEKQEWLTEPDLRRAFALFMAAQERQRDLAGAVATGLLLDRSLNAPCYRVPLHDELAVLLGTADREEVRRQITLDAAFFERLPKSRRIAAVAMVSPSISKLIGAEKPGDISSACAEFFAGSDFARRRWKMTADQIASARRWLPSFLEFNEDSGKPRIADVVAAEAEQVPA